MRSKTNNTKWLLLGACQILIVFIAAAQPPGGGGGGGGVAAPIDGGAVGLLVAIAGYGYRTLRGKEKLLNQQRHYDE